MRTLSGFLAAGLVLLPIAAGAVELTPSNPAPKDLYGTYGPRGDCRASPRVSLDSTGLYIVIGSRRGRVPRVDTCFSCPGGARYDGIEVWLSPMAGKVYAAHFRFNADERRGALVVEPTHDVVLGTNLRSVVAASPYRRCGPPTQAAP
ncbi:MAG: hypothetical protein AB7O80_16555 [Acetobacteraceae bacterium]